MSKTISNFYQIPWLNRILLSIILAVSFTYLLTCFFQPYDFVILESILDSDEYNLFHDFDNDGLSETLEIRKNGPENSFIYIRNWNGGIIDQTNYLESVHAEFIMFADITEDDLDEIFVFTQEKDSLFLYIHDLATKRAICSRLLLLRGENRKGVESGYIKVFPGMITDPRIYRQKMLLFAVRNNFLPVFMPRSVYAFDLDQQKMIGEFKTHSPFTALFTYDLTGDGLDEIIVVGSAWGNIHYPAEYRDDCCWLFVLDQELKPVFKPLNFMEYPAELTCLPLEIRAERYLLVMTDYTGDKNISSMMYLIDAKGKIQLRRQNPFLNSHLVKPLIDHHINPPAIYGWKGEHSLIKLDHQLETVQEVSTPFKDLRPLFMADLDANGKRELYYTSGKRLLAYDMAFNLLASLDLPTANIEYSLRQTGPGNFAELGLTSGRNFYHLKLSANRIYSILPILFTAVFVFFVLGLNGFNYFLIRRNIFIKFFYYFFYNSAQAFLILDQQGKIRYTNTSVKVLLDLPHQPSKGDHIQTTFREYPQLLDLIKQGLMAGQAVKQTIVMENSDNRCEFQATVEPFSFFLKSGISYLITFFKTTPDKISHNMQSWSRAVQKMAHDIKTPLSTVILNLKMLQMRLAKITMTEDEQNGLSDDISMMQAELENIQAMTKNFLKFSNLDHPHFQAFNIRDIIDKSIAKYRPFLKNDLEIQISIDDDVKPVWADPQQIEIVFHILLENALEAMRGKGIIRISVSLAQLLEQYFAEYLEVEIADTGTGIDPKDKQKIFETYFTTKEMGSGMGLAIAKKIIEDHNCSIDVICKPNLGAVFIFSLPVIKED